MKDVFKILEKNRKASLQRMIPVHSAGYPSGEWQALQIIESSAQAMRKRISSALPAGFCEKIGKVNLEMLQNPRKGQKVLVKAQLYPLSKNENLLKVFVHEMDHKGKSIKLAKARYYIHIFPAGGVKALS